MSGYIHIHFCIALFLLMILKIVSEPIKSWLWTSRPIKKGGRKIAFTCIIRRTWKYKICLMLNLLKSQRKILVTTFSMISPIISHSKLGSSSLSKHEFMHVLEYATNEKCPWFWTVQLDQFLNCPRTVSLTLFLQNFYHRACNILVHRLVQWDAL